MGIGRRATSKAVGSEEAVNISIGFTANIGESFTVTVDLYTIDVDDRIAKTFNIPIDPNDPNFQGVDFTQVSFYTNGLETETDGFDIVALWDLELMSGSDTSISLAWNHNETEVTRQNQVNGIDPVSSGSVFNIENNLPENRFSANVNHSWGDFGVTVRANWYDETIDERNNREPVDSALMVDLEGRWYVNDSFTAILGANNVFDEFPNAITTRLSNGLAWPRRTPIGYDGGMWYLKGVYNFN